MADTNTFNDISIADIAKVNTISAASIAKFNGINWVEPVGATVSTYIGSNSSTTDGVSWTFTNEPIGDAASDRLVIVCMGARSDGDSGGFTLTSATIGGAAATILNQITRAPSSSRRVLSGMFGLGVAAGATANIGLHVSQTGRGVYIAVYTITGADGLTPFATSSDTVSPLSLSLNVENNGSVIGTGAANAGPNMASWTGITEDMDLLIEGGAGGVTAAHEIIAVGGTPYAVSCTVGSDGAGVACSWSPA